MKMLKMHCPSFLRFAGLCLVTLLGSSCLMAQDSTATKKPEITNTPVKYTFESIWILDNQTVMVPIKKAFEFDIQHRFGTVNNGYSDFWGIYAPANIRLGFQYVPMDNLMVGFGFCKDRLQWDFNAKYALIKQTDSKRSPVSVSVYGDMAIDTRSKEYFVTATDRIAYFTQILIARKFSKSISVQVAPSLSYFNNVPAYMNSDDQVVPEMENAHFAVAFSGRYKINSKIDLLANYDQPLTQHLTNNPHPNISFGIEFNTGGHAFQLYAGNYYYILPQNNNFYNQNDYTKGQFLIAFNITRLWD